MTSCYSVSRTYSSQSVYIIIYIGNFVYYMVHNDIHDAAGRGALAKTLINSLH